MGRKQRRFLWIGCIGAILALALGLILMALSEEIVYFYTPTDVHEKKIEMGTPIRLGGLVKKKSLVVAQEGGEEPFVTFEIEDANKSMPVYYTGILPDLFREGQGIVAEGKVTEKGLEADTILAKHDETYMPKDVADRLKEQGIWQGGEAPQ